MENLKPGRKPEKLIYRSGDNGEVVEVSVYYDKGGSNPFSGGNETRGVYIAVTPITIKDRMVSFTLFSGVKMLARATGRKNQKDVDQVAAKLDPYAPEIARLFAESGKLDAIHRLEEVLK